jgi:catechol 2,3-dioxygenase-like lactoylglutathione lyase family enzyme
MDATVRFWRDLLGMRLVAGLGHQGYRQYFLEISGNDLLTFFEWPEVTPAEEKEHGRTAAGPFVFDHVSFGVETEEMLWGLKGRLSAAGFWVSEVIDHGFIYSIYSFDPNGIPIEFSWNVNGIDIRKSPRMADASPSAVALEGAEPQPDKWPAVDQSHPPDKDRRIYPGQGRDFFMSGEKNGTGDQGI